MTLSITLRLKKRHGAGGTRRGQTHEASQENIFLNRVKKNQLDAQRILSTRVFRQPLHVSGVSWPTIRRYSRMYTSIGAFIINVNSTPHSRMILHALHNLNFSLQ